MDSSSLDLADIQAAMQAADRQTPSVVLNAFVRSSARVLGHQLVPITAGHDIIFQALDHPASRHDIRWSASDVAVALYVLTRSFRETHQQILDDTFELRLADFLDELPAGEIEAATAEVMRHWMSRFATSLRMRAPGVSAQKKTADSGGG